MAVTWTVVDEAYVLAVMATPLRVAYDAWILANPAKAGRLAEIAAGVVAEWREGVARNASVILDADTDAVPESCVQYVLTVCGYLLALELGATVDVATQAAFENAGVQLRWLAGPLGSRSELASGSSESEETPVEPRPSYKPGVPRRCI